MRIDEPPADERVVPGPHIAESAEPTGAHDFCIHGVVNLRFIGAPRHVTRRFATQWGPVLTPPRDLAPDVTVRFADLDPSGLTHIGLHWAAASEEHFYLLDEVDGEVIARMPMADLGAPCEIVCPVGATKAPFLTEIICLAFLGKGYIPLHASAFTFQGVGVVTMGWPKGGKTGALLAFLNHGARYVGDEWVLLARDGTAVLGLPLPVSVSAWQLPHLRGPVPPLGIQQRLMFRAIDILGSIISGLRRGRFSRSEPVKLLRKALPALRRQLKVTRSPAAWFGEDTAPLRTSPDRLFLLTSHDTDDIRVESHDARKLAMSMAHANEHEWRPLLERYRAFKFAFPDRSNPLLDDLTMRLSESLASAIATKPVYRVLHPYGRSLDALFTAMRPHCES